MSWYDDLTPIANWRDKQNIVHQAAIWSWQIKMACGAIATNGCRPTNSSVDCMACLVRNVGP